MQDLKPTPNLIIMGAQKSGTTSLHEYLKVHPDIFMSSPIKEPGFYLGDERAKIFWERMGQPISSREELLHERMLKGYEGERWFGDASTYYTIGQRSRLFEIPQRMHAENPDMRFIYILRNPVERIISNYLHAVTRGRFKNSLEDFLGTPEGSAAILTSRYYWQLQAYLDLFDAGQFHVIVFEEFLEQPELSMAAIWDFLDLPTPLNAPDFVAYNTNPQDKTGVIGPTKDLKSVLNALKGDVVQLQRLLNREIPYWSELSFAR